MTQTDNIVRLVREVLGTDLLGAYLHGSAVLCGLRPRSDVDVLAVSRRPTTDQQRRALGDGLREMSGARARRGPARPIELTIVVQSEVRPWRYPPRSEFLYGDWLREQFERGDIPAPGPCPDLAPIITIALLGDCPLFGPPPAEVLDPVPHADLIRAVVGQIPDLRADLEPDTSNVLLTLARIWMTVSTGAIASKDEAADWAIAHLPAVHRPVLANARAIYLGNAPDRWDGLFPQVHPQVDHVIQQIERLAAAALTAR